MLNVCYKHVIAYSACASYVKACLPRVCKPVLLKAFPTQVLFESCHRWCVHALCIIAHLAPLCSRHKTHFYAFCGRRGQTVHLSYLDLASFRCRWPDRSRWTSTTGNKKHILRFSGNNTSHILFPISTFWKHDEQSGSRALVLGVITNAGLPVHFLPGECTKGFTAVANKL